MMRNSWVAVALTAAMVMGAGFTTPVEARRPAQDAKPGAAAPAPLNLNVATVADLQKLPGIGPALAARIVEYRQKNGGFKKIEDLIEIL